MRSNDAFSQIQHQIMWNRLIAVVEEQAQTLLRTAFSMIVREAGDLSAGVFDLQGRMLAQAVTGTPGHVNSMAESVKHFIRHFPVETMEEGDIYITNDPWMGTGHLNDFVLTTPCFRNGRIVALFSCTSHIMDIGGLGNGPDATDVFMEGIYIPMLKLAERGKMNETLMAMIKANTRNPIDTVGDVYSLASCNEVGCRRLVEMMDEFGLDDLDELGGFIIDNSRQAVLNELARLPKGSWTYEMRLDGYEKPIDLKARLTITDSGMHMDYTGTTDCSVRGINVPHAYTTAYTVFGMACIVGPQIPNNAGSLERLTVSAPEGAILNAPYPKPVSTRHVIGQMLPDMVFGCLRQAAPERVPAEGTSCLYNIMMRGDLPPAEQTLGRRVYSISVTSNGGTGARPESDGLSATAYPSGVKGTPVEIAESAVPVIYWRKEYREDSGGPGATRGGMGQAIEIGSAIDAPFELGAAFDRIEHPPRGVEGGKNGAPGYVGLKSGAKLRGKGFQTIPPEDRLVILTPGGGGRGEPQRRDRAAVARDLENGLVSPETARNVYGFALKAAE